MVIRDRGIEISASRVAHFRLFTSHLSRFTFLMIIGIPKEIKEQERRIALVPSAAELLTKRGHTVLVEKYGGVGAGFLAGEYKKRGAGSFGPSKKVFYPPALIVKMKEHPPTDISPFGQ